MVFGQRLGLVGVSKRGVCRETWFNGGEYMGCFQRDLV